MIIIKTDNLELPLTDNYFVKLILIQKNYQPKKNV